MTTEPNWMKIISYIFKILFIAYLDHWFTILKVIDAESPSVFFFGGGQTVHVAWLRVRVYNKNLNFFLRM